MKLTNNLSINSRMQKYMNQGFTPMQLEQIQIGLESGVDVSKYAFVKYDVVLMIVIYELMMFDDDFDINDFSMNKKLSIDYLLTYHYSLTQRYRMLMPVSDLVAERILRNGPYYTSESTQAHSSDASLPCLVGF